MQAPRLIWFRDEMEWKAYVDKHMSNALVTEGLISIMVETKAGKVLANWNNGAGQVFEGRSDERLKKDS